MKISHLLPAALLGLIVLVGCQQATSAPAVAPLSSAPASALSLYSATSGSTSTALGATSGTPPANISVSGSSSGGDPSTLDYTVTMTNYVSGASTVSGTIHLTGITSSSASTMNIREVGTFTISGPNSGTVGFDLRMIMVTSPSVSVTMTGTVTINGITYDISK